MKTKQDRMQRFPTRANYPDFPVKEIKAAARAINAANKKLCASYRAEGKSVGKLLTIVEVTTFLK